VTKKRWRYVQRLMKNIEVANALFEVSSVLNTFPFAANAARKVEALLILV
jgi:hypothetical protein